MNVETRTSSLQEDLKAALTAYRTTVEKVEANSSEEQIMSPTEHKVEQRLAHLQ